MMRKHIAERFQNYSGGLSLDTEALKRYPDVIDLSIGDTDYTTDRRIIDAAFADACAGYTHYGDPKGDPELIAAIRRAWKEDFGQDVSEDEVLVTTSSCIGMSQAMMGILNPGDEVIVFGPYFADYASQAALAGGRAVEVITREADGYRPREDALRSAITPRTRAMIVNTPCNPTGAGYDGEFIPMRTLPGMAERTVTLNSFSKNFLMTGWRVGYIIAHPELIQVFKAVNDALTYAAPSISQRAAIKALSIRDEIAQTYITKYRDRVFYASDCIEKIPYLTLLRPRGTFYLFPGIAKTGMDDRAFCAFLLEKAHLLVSPGSAFGSAGAGHFRIACTVSQDKLAEAMRRLAALSAEFE